MLGRPQDGKRLSLAGTSEVVFDELRQGCCPGGMQHRCPKEVSEQPRPANAASPKQLQHAGEAAWQSFSSRMPLILVNSDRFVFHSCWIRLVNEEGLPSCRVDTAEGMRLSSFGLIKSLSRFFTQDPKV